MPGLLRGVARTAVVAGTASAVSGRVQHRQQQKWADQDAQQQQNQAPEQQMSPQDDTISQIQQLSQLVNQGILTQEEFEAKKKQLLGILVSMKFFGLFTLVVLPLFLWVCIRMLKQSELGKTMFGKFLELLFYLFIIFSIVGVILIIELV